MTAKQIVEEFKNRYNADGIDTNARTLHEAISSYIFSDNLQETRQIINDLYIDSP